MTNSTEQSYPNSIRRGEIIRVRLNPVEGSEQGGERPALVISPDVINTYSTVILVAALTSRKTERIYPFETLILPPDGGVTVRSKVMLPHLRAIDKSRIIGSYGVVCEETMERVEEALKIVTGLTRL